MSYVMWCHQSKSMAVSPQNCHTFICGVGAFLMGRSCRKFWEVAVYQHIAENRSQLPLWSEENWFCCLHAVLILSSKVFSTPPVSATTVPCRHAFGVEHPLLSYTLPRAAIDNSVEDMAQSCSRKRRDQGNCQCEEMFSLPEQDQQKFCCGNSRATPWVTHASMSLLPHSKRSWHHRGRHLDISEEKRANFT